MTTYKEIQFGDKKLEIFYDLGCESPRENCNLTLLHIPNNSHINEVKNVDKRDIAHTLPLYRYSHGCVAYNTTGFRCPWDSGRVGSVYLSKEKVRDIMGCKRVTKKMVERCIPQMIAEVETFSKWANGECYGWAVYDSDGNNEFSCGGYIGDPNNMIMDMFHDYSNEERKEIKELFDNAK